MHAVQASGELILERGEGCHLWDDQGNRYIDSTGGLWYANVGYGRAEIADAAAAQMRKLHAYSHYGDVSSRPTTDLAERISAIAPMDDAAVFFTSGGGESIETVVKLVRRYWSLARPARPHRDHLARARLPRPRRLRHEHRRHRGVQGRRRPARRRHRPRRLGLGRGARGDDPRARRRSDVAAFFCEPIIGAGGVLLPPDGLSAGGARDLPHARRALRRRRGDLRLRPRRRLVRLQPRRARSRTRSRSRRGSPPATCRSAASSSAARSRSRSGTRRDAGVWRHGYTYSGHASAAAAAHANLDIIEREGLVARGLELETEIPAALAPLLDHELVTRDPRGLRRRRRGPDRPGAARRRPGADRSRRRSRRATTACSPARSSAAACRSRRRS